MYLKLAFRNIKRSLREYLIYFIILTLIVMLMYSFLALGFSDDIIHISENMVMLKVLVIILSIVVTLISSFVISYAVSFMLSQRKKEFATYELLGMEVKTIQKLFLIENMFIGAVAFFVGFVLGTGLVGVLIQIVKNIFGLPYSYDISFCVRAFVVTTLFLH